MAVKGERFELNLDDSDEDHHPVAIPFIKDILEKDNDNFTPPSAPKLKSTQNGFPQPRPPKKGPSRFKQQAKTQPKIKDTSRAKNATLDDVDRIGQENQQKLDDMSVEEIEQERKELLASLTGSLVGRLQSSTLQERMLKKSKIEEPLDDLDKPLREIEKQPEPKEKPAKKDVTADESEWERIGKENQQRMEEMSPEEIEEAQKELFAGLKGSLIERLLKRSHIEEPPDDFDKPLREADMSLSQKKTSKPDSDQQQAAKISEMPSEAPSGIHTKEKKTVSFATPEPAEEPISPQEQSPIAPDQLPRSIHFPSPIPPTLDPSSPSFLRDLHSKYFPTLPYDPQSLSWMTPTAPSEKTYNPSASSFSASELRFDFAGNLLPPKLASQIPTTKGLHHHGLAPDAAGYTISELSIYARSMVQAQRCMAFQTLGRVLFKLGTGVFGSDKITDANGSVVEADEDDAGAVLCKGLWTEVARERILDILVEEANRDESLVRHRSAHAMAVEAVWLWRRGGGRTPERPEQTANDAL